MKKQPSPTWVSAAAVLGAGVHGDVFANVAVGADHEPRRPAAIAERLRRRTERGERMDDGARADRRVAGDVDMGDQPTAVAEHDMRADGAIRTDADVLSDRGTRPRCAPMDRSCLRSCVADHGADFGFGHDLAAHLGHAAVPPHVSPLRELRHVILDGVAGQHGLAEFRLVDGQEINRLRLVRSGWRCTARRRSAPCPRSSARREIPDCPGSGPGNAAR